MRVTGVSSRPLFTVFTPTYNRAAKLFRPFESLRAQTFGDFEWLIVDDGSYDDTRKLVSGFQGEVSFPIRYIFQEHAGLHFAFNKGIFEAKGELFLPLDSDDALEPVALERLLYHWNCIPEEEKQSYSGVCYLCRDERGRIIGDRFPKDIMDSDSLEITYRYRVKGQKGGFHRARVMREFPFDATSEMGCNPWRRIARRYRMRFVNEVLEIYYHDSPEDSLARSRKRLRPMTGVYRTLEILNREIDYFNYWPGEFFRAAARYARFSFHCGFGFVEQKARLENRKAKLLWSVSWPVGYAIYCHDKLIRKVRTY